MAPNILVICGPTASGKTALAVELALRHSGEVVSADSMQIYRGMDIGTAKPTPEEMRGVPHHMLDVADPWEDYSVARYVQDGLRLCGRHPRPGKAAHNRGGHRALHRQPGGRTGICLLYGPVAGASPGQGTGGGPACPL